MLGKTSSSEVLFTQLVLLNHGTHSTIEDENPILGECGLIGVRLFFGRLDETNNFQHLIVSFIMTLVFFDNTHSLFYLTLIVEVHLQMHTVATNVVK